MDFYNLEYLQRTEIIYLLRITIFCKDLLPLQNIEFRSLKKTKAMQFLCRNLIF